MSDLCLTLNGLWELQSSALSTPDTMSQQVHYLDKQGDMGHASEIHDLAVRLVKENASAIGEQAFYKLKPDRFTSHSISAGYKPEMLTWKQDVEA